MLRSIATSRGQIHLARAVALGGLVSAVMLFSVNIAGAAQAIPAARPKPVAAPSVHRTRSVSGVQAVATRKLHPHNDAARRFQATHIHLPGAESASSVLPATGGARVRMGSSPISVQEVAEHGTVSGGPVDLSVLSQQRTDARGLHGVVFTLAAPGKRSRTLKLTVDYSAFAQVSGGGYGARLGLVSLPGCAADATTTSTCPGQTALPSRNDANRQTVTSTVTLPASGRVVLAVTPEATSTADGSSPAATSGAVKSASVVEGASAVGGSGTAATRVAAASAGGGSAGDGGGPSGSYAATTLSPFGSWAQGGSTGSFTYSYPISVPPSASAMKASVALGYDSGSVDAKTSATSAQSSWVGDGWSAPESYIEQSYAPCPDISSSLTNQDDCYAGPIVSMSLNGQSSQLVCNASFSSCTPQEDDGSVVKRVTGGSNGTYDGDYWTITKRDGTVYSFGLNHLPGYATGKASTNSVQTVPVYSSKSGEPCYHKTAATFAGSVCTMGYRWNLDYVKDVHGQAMSYYYSQSTNYYGENKGASNVSYVRDSYLDHIDYGFTDGNAYGTVANKVLFATGSRCVVSNCGTLSSSTAANYPDVPFDLVCASDATCAVHSPSFFSTVRLTAITTQQYNVTKSGYVSIDKYDLVQTIPTATSGDVPTLWLSSVQHTGYSTDSSGTTTSLSTPPVLFSAMSLENRVDTTTVPLPPMYRNRIGSIKTETGSVLTVIYDRVNPCSSPVTVSPAANTSSCFPVSWTPEGYAAPVKDWFNKYVVVAVNQSDITGGASDVNTSYAYGGGAAWHYDDNEVVRSKYRTYGQFRGYGDVKTYLGSGQTAEEKTLTDTTYYRGMTKNNNSTVVNVTDSLGGVHEDAGLLQGDVLETRVYQGDGGPLDHTSITSYWQSPATATRVRTGLTDLNAHIIAVAETLNRQAVTSGSSTTYRQTETDVSYDTSTSSATYGLAQYTYSHAVPVDPAFDQCTSSTYAKVNAAANLVGLVSGEETDSVACAGFTEGSTVSVPGSLNTLSAPASVTRPDQVVSATRSFYDVPSPFSTTFPQTVTPTFGDVTITQSVSGYGSGAFTWVTKNKNVFDTRGRLTSSTDAAGRVTTTAYTDTSAGLTTGMKITNPKSQFTSTTLDPQRAQALTVTDPNGVVTTSQYDALGRVTAVWLANRPTSQAANYTYSYVISQNGVSSATTKRLGWGGTSTSTLLYDSLLRPRQSQSLTPQGGRMISDEIYDTRGWVKISNNGWLDSASTPNTTIVSATDLAAQVPDSDRYTYDGLGRVVIDSSRQNNTQISAVTTIYGGDRTTVIPPTGGVTQTTFTDIAGRTTKLSQYTSAPTVTAPSNTTTGHWSITGGTTTSTTYGYDGHGNQDTTTDNSANVWKSTYNLLGQVTTRTDPDAGASSMVYDTAGNLSQSTDSRGKSVSFTYDQLGRKTASFDSVAGSQVAFGSAGANQTGKWVYDNSDAAVAGLTDPIGHVTTATSYANGGAYVTQSKGFTAFGSSLGETITIPSTENAALAGSYTFTHTYLDNVDLPYRDTYPAFSAAGLPAETITHSYVGQLDMPAGLAGNVGLSSYGYNGGNQYDAYGRVLQSTLGSSSTTGMAYLTNAWDPHTGLLTEQTVGRSLSSPSTIDDHLYTYDLAGNTTKDAETRLGSSASSETQCYTFDPLQRLSAAWTATDGCAATPTSTSHATVGDPLGTSSAYWSTWTYNALGQRATQVDHAGGTGAATTTSYTYNGNGTSQPTTLTSTSGAPTGASTYGYDTAGNMTSRTAAQGTQTLTWNASGQLAGVSTTPNGSSTATNSTYVYDTDGNLLTQHDGNAVTLYLPGEQLSVSATGTVSGVRYYSLPGGGTAYRTGSGNAYGYMIGDAHGTVGLTLDYTGQIPTWRQFTPFGQARGAAVSWVDNRTFLDKPTDVTTGLTSVGARFYDPTVAQFVSLDPILSPGQPQSLNGYSYAGENPVTFADPTGLQACTPDDGPSCNQQNGRGHNPPDPGTSSPPDPGDTTAPGSGGSGTVSNGSNATTTRAAPPQHHGWMHWPSWHTVAKVAVGVAVAAAVGVAVGVACASVVGCFILAGVAAGAAAGAATYGTSVALGDDEFNVRGLATSTAIGGGVGLLTAGAGAAAGSVIRAVASRGVSAAADSAGGSALVRSGVTAARNLARLGGARSANSDIATETEADAARLVPDPKPVYKPNGAPDRSSPWYVSYRDADGNLQTVGNLDGVHTEVRIQERMPGTPMSRPFGWRTLDTAKGPEWVEGTVCQSCQIFPPSLFPPGTRGAPGGPWGHG